jgi:hypothetical protein
MWFFDPVIDWEIMTGMMAMIRSRSNWRDASRCFFDLSMVHKIDLDFNHLLAFSKFDKSIMTPSMHVRYAFLTPTPLTFGMVRMYEGLMADANAAIRSFKVRNECAVYLNVPLNVLLAEVSNESSA